MRPTTLPFSVYVPYSEKADDVIPFFISGDAYIKNLENDIRQDPQLIYELQRERLHLFKCGNLSNLPVETLYERTLDWIRQNPHTERLQSRFRLNYYFPTGPAPEEDMMIDIVAVTGSTLERDNVVYALPDICASKATNERLSLIHEMRKFASLSEGVKSEEKISSWTNENTGVHIHRPTGNYGPPTTLFQPAFARLSHRLKNLNEIDELSSDYLEWSHKFIVVCGDGFKKESLQEGELKQIINMLIGEDGIWQVSLEGGIATPDAVWVDVVMGVILRAILELKNIDGVGGNASLQANLLFTKTLTQREHEKYVARSNFPVILIGLMGSRLEISTAIFTNGVYSDKILSEEFYIDAWQSTTVLRVGRIFKALSLAFAELREYYRVLANNPSTKASTAHLYPNPLPVNEHTRIPRLHYHGKLSCNGQLLNKMTVNNERPYALYRAKMHRDEPIGEVEVVVKFTVQYHEEAHRILAKNQLAPTLHFCIPLVGDMYMVIMDYIDSAPLFCLKELGDHQAIYSDVDKAIKLLHGQDLVFGDLRAQNVLPKPSGGAMLIDFDWVGKHRVDRYPASWNNNTHAPGVGRRELMDKAHDLFMLKELQTLLEGRW